MHHFSKGSEHIAYSDNVHAFPVRYFWNVIMGHFMQPYLLYT